MSRLAILVPPPNLYHHAKKPQWYPPMLGGYEKLITNLTWFQVEFQVEYLKVLVGNPWLRHSSHPKRYVKLYCLHNHVITPRCKQHCEYTHRQVHLHEHPPTHL
jgi:hypothetical protein